MAEKNGRLCVPNFKRIHDNFPISLYTYCKLYDNKNKTNTTSIISTFFQQMSSMKQWILFIISTEYQR